jgi:hypothetical protein
VIVLRALKRSARRVSSLAAVGVALGAVAAAPATAATVQGFGPVGSFGFGGSGPGGLTTPHQVAVDDATGNVLVADPGNGRVEVFQPDGTGSATYLTEFGSAAVSQPYGVAVDQSTGDVYVAGGDGVQPKIARFTSDGQPTPTYTVDPSFTSPAAGAGAGQIGDFNSSIAVDPATHDLIVGDRGNQRIDRFSSTGAFVRGFDGASVPGGFTSISDVAATASSIYVTDIARDNSVGTGASRIVQFTAAGAYQAQIGQSDTPVAAAVDGATGNVVAAGNTRYDDTPKLNVYHGNALSAAVGFAAGAAGSYVVGIAVGGGVNRHVYVVTDTEFGGAYGVTGVQTFDPAPAVEADDVTSADSHSVDLAGFVNPEGHATTAHFEWLDNGAWTPLPDIPGIGSGTTDQAVTTQLTGLNPYSSYTFRLVATDTRTTAVSITATARTAGAAPTVVTGDTPTLTATTASIQGTVTPLGQQSAYYFEYGTTADYGRRSPAGAPGVAGNGFAARGVSADLQGLAQGTTYHYRLVATNASGTSYGADRTFTTSSAEVTRGYEMVSPAEKTGVPVDSHFTGFKARADGNAIVYTTQKAVYDGASAAVYKPRVLGTRTASGWLSDPLDPPTLTSAPGQDTFGGVVAVSDDMSRVLVISTHRLGAQGVEGNGNLYVHNLSDDSYDLVASSSSSNLYAELAGIAVSQHFVGASSDLGTVAFNVDVPLRPGDPSGDNNVYTWTKATGLQLASVMPDGTPAVGVGSTNSVLRDGNVLSSDGSRVFFTVTGVGLFLRQHGVTTSVVASQPAGPNDPNDPSLLAASPDGRYVIFAASGSNPLTNDAPAVPNDVYRYDVDRGTMEYMATDAPSNTSFIGRPASNRFYFTTLHGGDLYYVEGNTSTLIASGVGAISTYAASPDGRYFAYRSGSEIYLYDAASGSLSCPSCRSDGGGSGGLAQLGQADLLEFGYVPRAVRDDGTLYFDTPTALVPRDTNGTRDVYMERGGKVSLITPGTGHADATFVDATPDGSDVFFVTDEQLVGQDRDGTADLYDARVGGGIAAQNPGPQPAPCGGSECREPVPGPTTSDASPTMSVTQRPVKSTPVVRPRLTLVRSSVGRTSIKITVTTSSRGRIRASGSTVRATTRNATKAATYTLTVPLTQKVRASRKKGHRVKLSVRVALTAPFASPVSIKLTRTVGK